MAALWKTPPRRPESVVRTYVWRLRRLLEPGRTRGEAWQVLRSVPGGYLLRLDDGSVDLELAERQVADARARSAAGETAGARGLLDDALALWREPALTDVPGPFARTERSRLEERRLDVVEARLEAMVKLGENAAAATELARLVETHRLREGLHYLLVQALSRTGRQKGGIGDLPAHTARSRGNWASSPTPACRNCTPRYSPRPSRPRSDLRSSPAETAHPV